MVSTRDQLFAQAVEMITQGACVDIVGARGSGRTRFAERLRNHFANRSWRVIDVRAVASLRGFPMMALALAGIEAAKDSRPSAIPAVVQELSERLQANDSLLIVDDWDDLDEVSWGIICAVQRRRRLPVVIIRLQGRDARHSPTGIRSSTIETSFTLELPQLRYDELELAISERLGAPVDAATLSRVYAKSGGNVGLAFALVDAASREGSLEARDGVWVATHDLWSPSLSSLVEVQLEGLEPAQLDLLETLSMLGVVDAASIAHLSSAAHLEALEQLGLVELLSSGSRLLISVQPPLLVEYFRHTPRPARRLRLSRAIEETLDPENTLRFGDAPITAFDDDHSAQFIRLVHEQQRTRTLVARNEWAQAQTPEAAVNYLETLLEAPSMPAEIDALLQAPPSFAGSEEAHARWCAAEADDLAYTRHQPERALERLRATAGELPEYGPFLLARAVELEIDQLGDPDLSVLPDPFHPELPGEVAVAVHRALAYVATCHGRLDDSDRHLAAIRVLNGPVLDLRTSVVALSNLIARGDTSTAARHAIRSLDESRARFDPLGMRGFGAVAVFCAVIDGRYGDAEDLLEVVSILGEPLGRPPFAHLSLTIMSSVVASRRGQRKLAEARNAEFERIPLADGPLPSQARGWARMQTAASSGDQARAAEITLESANQLWARGARLAAAMALTIVVALDPSVERLAEVRERISAVEGGLVGDQLRYLTALVAQDPVKLAEAGAVFEREGRFGLALAAMARAATLHRAHGEAEAAAELTARHEQLRKSLVPGSYDATRFRALFVELTEREREIARLAASGLSNQQIADELVLSVRTVESHLHRVMRKTGAERRSHLRDYLERADLLR